LDYLENNLQVLYQKLDSTIYPVFLEEILKAEMQILLQQLEVGQSPTYYEKILSHVKSISNYFHSGGVDPSTMASCKLCCHLMRILRINSMTSENLMLLYYKSLTNNQATVNEYFGHLAVKVGYKTETDGVVTIHANVVQARNLPGMSNDNLSCPFVAIELCPLTMFPVTEHCRTKVRADTINPLYEEKFQFPDVADEYRLTSGSVIIFSVWHHEALLPNAFLGEVVLRLCDVREIAAGQTVNDLPVIMMPLQRPKEPREGPYKVLKERSSNDRIASVLLEQRNRTVAFRTRYRLCRQMKSIVATITGKRLEVVGRNSSICTSATVADITTASCPSDF
jgi:BAI1-associated protein 3